MHLFEELCPKPLQEAFCDVDMRLVGGCVRDFLIHSSSQDIDFAVPLPPPEIIHRLKQSKISYLLTGVKFGTVTALVSEKSFEITSLRKDITHHGRHPKVIYTTSFEEDALRRDFTFNALYIGKDNQLFDPFGGMDDLKNGIIKFIGNPYERITEDPLRLLRFYRFFAKIASHMDSSSHFAVKECMHLTHSLSKERIWNEFSKILTLKRRVEALTLLKEDGFSQTMSISPNLRYLEHDDVSPLTLFASLHIDLNLNWSREESRFLQALLTQHRAYDVSLTLNFPKFLAKQIMYLRFLDDKCSHAELQKILNEIDLYTVPKFPLKGSDLLSLGIPAGPNLGKILQKVRKYWEMDPESTDHDKCLALISQILTEL